MSKIVELKQGKKLSDKINMDMNLIEMPLFSQNNKIKPNVAITYIIDKKLKRKVEVIPGAGLSIPNDFDQKVYLALVQIAMEFKEEHGLSVVDNKVYTTYYEIFTKLKVSMKGNINERIFQSMDKLKSTKYNLWNCCYQANSGIIAGLFSASFINDIKIMPKDSNSAKEAMDYIRVTKSTNVIELTLHSFFLHNILEKRGNLVHKYSELLDLDDSIARTIYLYCEKNRQWVGGQLYNTDKKMKITAKKLSSSIPLAFTSNTIPKTINRIRMAFDSLKSHNMIAHYVEYKGKPLRETWYEIDFDWSRHKKDYIITGREDFDITSISETELSSNKSINIEEIQEIDYSSGTGVVSKIISKQAIDVIHLDEKLPVDLQQQIKPILDRISPKTLEVLKQCFVDRGLQYIQLSIQYANVKSTSNYDKYLQDTLMKEWALSKVSSLAKTKNSDKSKPEKLALKEDKQKQRDLEKEQEHLNQKQIEHEYHKLNAINKKPYIALANHIIKKCGDNLLNTLHNGQDELVLSVFAVSNNRSYSKVLEGYCRSVLKVDLSVYALSTMDTFMGEG